MSSHLQLQLDIAKPFFSMPFKAYQKRVDYTWLTSLWEFTTKLCITIEVEYHWKPKMVYEHDRCIMYIINTLSFTPHQYHQVNCCRFIYKSCGYQILLLPMARIFLSAINGERDNTRCSSLHWPHSHRPSDWTAWAIFLQQVSLRGQLHVPLGLWLDTPHQHWQYYYDPDKDCVFYCERDTWTQYWPCTKGRSRSSGKHYGHPTIIDTCPSLSTLLPLRVT